VIIIFLYNFGPLKVGVTFNESINKSLVKELPSYYSHVATDDESANVDHMCHIDSWDLDAYQSEKEDVIIWNDNRVSIKTERNIRIEAEYSDHLNCHLSVFEGNDYWENNDRMRYWEFSQRISLYPRLIKNNLILIHCATIVVDGKAHVFLGPSGAGKTTIALKAQEADYKVLSDDTCLLRWTDDQVTALSVPYISKSGIVGGPGEYEVKAIYILEQDKESAVGLLQKKYFARAFQERIYEGQFWSHIFGLNTDVAKKILSFTLFVTRKYKPLIFYNSYESNLTEYIK